MVELTPGLDRQCTKLNRSGGVNIPYDVPCEHQARKDDANFPLIFIAFWNLS